MIGKTNAVTIISGGGGGVWISFTGTRTSNTTFTVTGNQTNIFSRALVIKWLESSNIKCAMVVSSVYSTVTTVTIIGDICGASANTFKYSIIPVEVLSFSKPGNITVIETNVMQTKSGNYLARVLGADAKTSVAGVGGVCSFDIKMSGTSMFDSKPTLSAGSLYTPVPVTANNGLSINIGSQLTIDTVSVFTTTPCTNAFIDLYIFQTRLLYLT